MPGFLAFCIQQKVGNYIINQLSTKNLYFLPKISITFGRAFCKRKIVKKLLIGTQTLAAH